MSQILLVQEEPRIASMLIEVVIPIGQQRVQLPIVEQLQSDPTQIIVVKSISLVTPKQLSHGIDNGLVNATIAELRKMALTIYSMGWERGQYIPILSLNNTADSDATTATTIPYKNNAPRFSDWRNVMWNKSYIQFANGQPSAGGADYTVMFDVQYMKFDTNGQEIEGAS
jgi:hypothetical protein